MKSEEKSTRSYKETGDSYYLNKMKELRKSNGSSPMDFQVGGHHYKNCKIQPIEYIFKNDLDYFEGDVVKYITRHRKKGEGRKDVEKAIHYAQMILELYYNK